MSKMTRLKLFLSSPFLLLLFLTFNPVKAVGQALPIPPDCVIFVNITTTAGSPATITVPNSPWFDNRTLQCQTWTIGYQATATGGTFTSLSVQAAQATVTPLTGAFADWAGTVVTGINPNTSSTGATSTLSTGCLSMIACTTPNSYIRVLLTRNNFVGTINGVLYGYRTGYPGGGGSGGGGSGCPGTVATPCVVDGVTAAGSAPTTPPVLVAGQDGAPGVIRTIKTDAVGEIIPSNASSADADGVSNTEITATGAGGGILYPRVFNRVFNGITWDRMVGNTTGVAPTNASVAGVDGVSNTVPTPTNVAGGQIYQRVFPYVFNGATNDRDFSCIFRAVAVTAPGTTGVIITGVMGKTTKICHLHVTDDTSANLTINSGTGTNCGMGTVRIDSYTAITAIAMDFTPWSPLTAVASGDDVCYAFSTSVANVSIVAIYAQY